MKTILTALALTFVTAGAGAAFDVEFSGAVEMGLIGSNDFSGSDISPYSSIEALAELTWETDGGVTFGITLPVIAEGSNQGLAISVSH